MTEFDPRTKPSLCPYCGYFFDCATAINGSAARPKPGDYSICINCGCASVLNADLSLRKRTAIDPVDDEARAMFQRARAACLQRGPLHPNRKPNA
jgi:hypothetical protein